MTCLAARVSGMFLLLSLAGSLAAAAASGVQVAAMKDWTIVVGGDAIPSERHAAEEFQSLFRQAAGIELPIASTPPHPTRNVFIGASEAMKSSPLGFEVESLGEEGLRIVVDRHNIAIAGGIPRGTLYGVYEFFERHFGVRFLTCDHTYLPRPGKVRAISCGDYTYTPPFSYRFCSYRENRECPAFATRLRNNAVTHDEKLGGVTHQNLINHSLYRWVSPAEYGESHPEYFALVGGKRRLDVGGGGPQPCVTNPEVIDIVTAGVLRDLDANPQQKNISVSQNDNAEYCRCPRCEEINQREGTPMGAHLAFVNAVAERVEKKYPDVKIGTLAYWYTRRPPKTIVPRKNVQIQLCSIECCDLHRIDDPSCPKNRAFCSDLEAWRKICNDIWIWTYGVNYSYFDLPFPNLRSISPNMRFFQRSGGNGVFMEANDNNTGGEISNLRNYVISRCLWNPSLDSWALAMEFCRLHYQRAAPPIMAHLKMIHDNAQKRGGHPSCFASPAEVGIDAGIAAKALAYFRRALALADDETIRARVEKASVCAYRAAITAASQGWKCEQGICHPDWPASYAAAVARYIELCRKYHTSPPSFNMSQEAYLEQLQRPSTYQAVTLENSVWRITVVPENNAQMVEMVHKPTRRNLLAATTHADITRGTVEELGLQGYEHSKPRGFTAEVDGSSITLTKILPDGSVFERRIFLREDDPETIYFESNLTHHGPDANVYQIKVRPEFSLFSTHSRDCNVVSAYVRDGRWIRFNRNWQVDDGPDAGVLREARDGALAFFNHELGYGMLLTYHPARIERPCLWWEPAWPQLNLELITPAVELAPGRAWSYPYELQYLAKPPPTVAPRQKR